MLDWPQTGDAAVKIVRDRQFFCIFINAINQRLSADPERCSVEEDRIYRETAGDKDFKFDSSVAAVFDNMISRSVPFYQELLAAEAQLLSRYLVSRELIYDLGCSTGNGILNVAEAAADKQFRCIGVDSSAAMLERARENAGAFKYGSSVAFIEGDVTEIALQLCGGLLCNYTMQFLRPLKREEFLSSLFKALRPGGILLLAEKTVSHDPELNRMFIDQGFEYKRSRGYSSLEIARKREALENILIPFSIEENSRMLRDAGFNHVSTFFQWFNFSAFLAVKDG